MYSFKVAIFCVSLCFVYNNGEKKLGSRCVLTGTCEYKGTCPGDVIGRCCRGLDCCDCQKQNATCGLGNSGTCVAIGRCSGLALTGRCCEDFECCKCLEEGEVCGNSSEGTCVADGSCKGLEVEGTCCLGFKCCEPCNGSEQCHSFNGSCQRPIDQCDGVGISLSSNLCCQKQPSCCIGLEGCERDIVPRAQWNARPTRGSSPLSTPVDFVFISHTVTSQCTTKQACSQLVKSIQNGHMDTNGWDDIGYSFLIGEDGNVYEGRGWDRSGAHTRGYNGISLGISVIGNFGNILPNSKALVQLQKLIACGIKLAKISEGYKLYGHRDASATLSPGQKLYDFLKTLNSFGPLPLVKPL